MAQGQPADGAAKCVSPPDNGCNAAKENLASEHTFTAPSSKHYVIARETYPSEPPPEVQGKVLSAVEGDLIELFMMQSGMGYGRRFKERATLINEGVFRLAWVNGIRLVFEDGKRRPVEVDIDAPQFGFQNPKCNDTASKLRTKRWRKKMEDVSKVWNQAGVTTVEQEVSAANTAAALEKEDAQDKAKKLRKFRDQEQRRIQREREQREQEQRDQEQRELILREREEEERMRRQKQHEQEQRENKLRRQIHKQLQEQLKQQEQQQQQQLQSQQLQSQQLWELQRPEVHGEQEEQTDEKHRKQKKDQEESVGGHQPQMKLQRCQDLKQEETQKFLFDKQTEQPEHKDSRICNVAVQTLPENLNLQNACMQDAGVQCMLLSDTTEEDTDDCLLSKKRPSKLYSTRTMVGSNFRKRESLLSASWDPHWEEQAAHLEALLSASSSGMEDLDGHKHRQPTVQRKMMTRKFAKSLLQAKRSGELDVIAEEWEKAHTEMANKASDLTALHDKVKRSVLDAHRGGSLENLAEEMANEAERKAAEVRELKERVFRAMFDMKRSKKLERSTSDMDDAQRELEMKALQLKHLMKRAWKGMRESKRQCELENIAAEMATGFQSKADSLKNKLRNVLLRAHRAGELPEMREELDELANTVSTMPDVVRQGHKDMAAQQRKRWAEFSSDSDSSFGLRSERLQSNYVHGPLNKAQQAVEAQSDADVSGSDADGGSINACRPCK